MALSQAITALPKLSQHSSPLQSVSSQLVVHSKPPATKQPGQEQELRDNLATNAGGAISEPLKLGSSPLVDQSELLMEEAIVEGLNQKALARRLGRSDVAVINARREKDAASFAAWSRKRDPIGLAWEYRGGRYYPIE